MSTTEIFNNFLSKLKYIHLVQLELLVYLVKFKLQLKIIATVYKCHHIIPIDTSFLEILKSER